MIAQCPRCATPRQGDRPFCQTCGFDYNSIQAPAPIPTPAPVQPQAPSFAVPPAPTPASPYGQPQGYGQPSPFSQPIQPPEPAQQYGQVSYVPPAPGMPALCPRCNAPLYPGYQACGNCGLDTRQVFAGVPTAPLYPTVGARKSNTPMLVAAAGLVLIIAVGGVFFATQNSGSKSPKPGASSSLIAAGTASKAPTATPEDTQTPEPTAEATDTPEPDASPTKPAKATTEPAPTGTWTKYTAPDGTWSAKFPGKATPATTDMSTGSGATAMKMILYYALDTSGAAYFVYTIDAGSSLSTMGSDAFLDFMANYMTTSLSGSNGTVESTSDTTLSAQPAKEFLISSGGQEVTMVMAVIKSRVYMVMISAYPDTAVFTNYFVSNFAVK